MEGSTGKPLRSMIRQLRVEVDAAFLYSKLADVQRDPALAEVLKKLSRIEESHATHAFERVKQMDPHAVMPGPTRRARLQLAIGKLVGYDFVMTNLANMEREIGRTMVATKRARGEKPTGFEANHMQIIQAVSGSRKVSDAGGLIFRMEGRHKSVGGNALRAAVLGANDGLVSNMSLVMGVAGAAVANGTVLITGVAGMIAGAISMSLGEWLSVQSSRELNIRQIELEEEELESSPEQEQMELSLLYQAKGMDEKSADDLARKTFENKEDALNSLVQEELGIDPNELGGSAWEAAIASFFLFITGAIIPVLPYFIWSGRQALYASLAFSVVGLFIIGAAITLFTGRGVLFSGFRQVLFGLAAAGITYAIGSVIGVSLHG